MSLDNKQAGDKHYAFEVNGIMKALRTLFRNIIELSNDVNNCVLGFGAWETKGTGTFTALTDGFIILRIQAPVNDSGTGSISIAGGPSFGIASNNTLGTTTAQLPVRKDDVVTIATSNVSSWIYWIPLNKQY